MPLQKYFFEIAIDVVICVDASASMRNVIDKVKEEILSFPQKYCDQMDYIEMPVEQFRVKLIVFGNSNENSQLTYESEFFVLPDQHDKFSSFVNSIEVVEGSVSAVDALKAIECALKSDWADLSEKAGKSRQIIMMFTNSNMETSNKTVSTDKSSVNIADQLEKLCFMVSHDGSESSNFRYRRFRCAVFAPEIFPWTEIPSWERSFLFPFQTDQDRLNNDCDWMEEAILLMTKGWC